MSTRKTKSRKPTATKKTSRSLPPTDPTPSVACPAFRKLKPGDNVRVEVINLPRPSSRQRPAFLNDVPKGYSSTKKGFDSLTLAVAHFQDAYKQLDPADTIAAFRIRTILSGIRATALQALQPLFFGHATPAGL